MNQTTPQKLDQDLRFSVASFVNCALRLLGWIVFLVVGPIFVAPEFEKMFEEFGIALPTLTQFVLASSNRVRKLWFILLPLASLLLVGQELPIFLLRDRTIRRILNFGAWLILLIAIVVFVMAMVVPTIEITNGLKTD